MLNKDQFGAVGKTLPMFAPASVLREDVTAGDQHADETKEALWDRKRREVEAPHGPKSGGFSNYNHHKHVESVVTEGVHHPILIKAFKGSAPWVDDGHHRLAMSKPQAEIPLTWSMRKDRNL